MSGRFSGADDTQPFFVIGVRVDVDDKQDGDWTDHPDRVPSLFAILKPIGHDDVQRIFPNLACKFERDPMLGEIRSRLLGIPLKLHQRPVYSIVCTEL